MGMQLYQCCSIHSDHLYHVLLYFYNIIYHVLSTEIIRYESDWESLCLSWVPVISFVPNTSVASTMIEIAITTMYI